MSRIIVDELQRWPTKLRTFSAGSCHLKMGAVYVPAKEQAKVRNRLRGIGAT